VCVAVLDQSIIQVEHDDGLAHFGFGFG
jgi:hypothetical protein